MAGSREFASVVDRPVSGSSGATPHRGLLQRWAQALPQGVAVFTSNVDGQFQHAGYPWQTLYECHGSIHWLQCLNACGEPPMRADALQPDVDDATCRWRGEEYAAFHRECRYAGRPLNYEEG